jgi:hypothetical protein
MKVRDLIKEFELLDPDLDVYIAADSEGNMFNKFSDIGEGYIEVLEHNKYMSRVDCLYNEEDLKEYDIEDFRKVIVLWP